MVVQTIWAFVHCSFLHLNHVLPFQPLFYLTHSCITFNIQWKSHFLQFPHAASSHFPCVSKFFSPTSTISFCYNICLNSLDSELLEGWDHIFYIFPSLLPSTVTGHVFRVYRVNLCMHEWMHGNQCPSLGNKMSLKDALTEKVIFKEIWTPLPTTGLPNPLDSTIPHPLVRISITVTHMQWNLITVNSL